MNSTTIITGIINNTPNVSDMGKAQYALGLYGKNATLPNEESCRAVYEVLVQNYPCMKELYCSPFGTTQTVFIIWIVLLCIICMIAAVMIYKKATEKKR